MGAGAIFLILVVIIVAVIAAVVLTGGTSKLKGDRREGDLPNQSSGERPEHLEVSLDTDDQGDGHSTAAR